jgi:hypothetical protein
MGNYAFTGEITSGTHTASNPINALEDFLLGDVKIAGYRHHNLPSAASVRPTKGGISGRMPMSWISESSRQPHTMKSVVSGKVYRYFEFPRHQYDEFLAAESHGRYFGAHIRGKFRDEAVHEAQLRERTS